MVGKDVIEAAALVLSMIVGVASVYILKLVVRGGRVLLAMGVSAQPLEYFALVGGDVRDHVLHRPLAVDARLLHPLCADACEQRVPALPLASHIIYQLLNAYRLIHRLAPLVVQ